MWKMERGRQAGPGQAEDTREKKSTEASTGHESSRAHTTVELECVEEWKRKPDWKGKLGRDYKKFFMVS